MAEAIYDGSLEGLFVILDEMCRGAPLPGQVRLEPGLLLGCLGTRVPEDPSQGDLFGTGPGDSCRSAKSRDAGDGAGIRAIARELGVSTDTVIKELKKKKI